MRFHRKKYIPDEYWGINCTVFIQETNYETVHIKNYTVVEILTNGDYVLEDLGFNSDLNEIHRYQEFLMCNNYIDPQLKDELPSIAENRSDYFRSAQEK